MTRGPRPTQLKFNNLFNEHFSQLFFFKSFLSRKSWRQKLLFNNDTIDGCVYKPCYCPGRIYIALGPWHFGDFCNIFLPNRGEDQKTLTI